MRGPLLLAPAADARTSAPALLCTAPIPGGGVVAGFVDLTVQHVNGPGHTDGPQAERDGQVDEDLTAVMAGHEPGPCQRRGQTGPQAGPFGQQPQQRRAHRADQPPGHRR
jgi:hypothetical protein